ncbi:MAG: aminomethyltransferase, partial [Pseudomonas sp.]
MNAPRVSQPREPGLFARAPDQERYRVAAGGVTLVDLQPGDGLQVIDIEGRQTCELLALDANGRSALASWGLHGAKACRVPQRVGQALSRRGIDPHTLPQAASLWDDDSPP